MIADCGPPLDISSIFQSIMKWIFLFRCRFHNGLNFFNIYLFQELKREAAEDGDDSAAELVSSSAALAVAP